MAAISGTINIHRDHPIHSTGTGGHDDDAVAHVDRFIDVVGDQEHRGAAGLPEAQHFVLHSHAREGIECAERFVEEENLGMIDQRARQGDALSHAAGKMVRKGVGEMLRGRPGA